jgi:hypothetical protein
MKGQKKPVIKKRAKHKASRLKKTANELRKISEEIAPFVRIQKLTEYTSAGQWREGNSPMEPCFPNDDEQQLVY